MMLLVLLAFGVACQKTPAQTQTPPKPATTAPAPAATPAGQQPPAAPAAKPVPGQLPATIARVNGEAIGKDEFEKAVKEFETFLSFYPRHQIADLVQYRLSMSYYDQMKPVEQDQAITQKAITAFKTLVRDYPDSRYAGDGLAKIEVCRGRLAQKELWVASYYLAQGNNIAAAKAEAIHANNHAEVIKNLGATPTKKIELPPILTTAENLKDAIAGETYERDVMYPAFLAQARAEKSVAVKTFHYALKAEAEHARLYAEALADLENRRGAGITYYVCPICGYTSATPEGDHCPICATPNEKFETVN
jgi:rubrerythrin